MTQRKGKGRTNNKLSPHMTPDEGICTWATLVQEASTVTTDIPRSQIKIEGAFYRGVDRREGDMAMRCTSGSQAFGLEYTIRSATYTALCLTHVWFVMSDHICNL